MATYVCVVVRYHWLYNSKESRALFRIITFVEASVISLVYSWLQDKFNKSELLFCVLL